MGSSTVRPAVVIGVVGALVAGAFSWVPSLWVDEAATVASVSRSWPELVHMLGTVDAVHGLYYAVIKAWFGLVGYTPFTLRVPSAVAIGGAASLTVLLGTRLAGRRVGVAAGVAFLLVPRVAWAGTEGRPYAMIALAAVGLTLVFELARSSPTRSGAARRWAAYSALGFLAVTLNLYLALIIVGHGVVLAVGARVRGPVHGHRPSAALRGWCIAVVILGCCSIPFALEVISQSRQVSWIPGLSPTTLRHVVVDAWFRSAWPFSGPARATLLVVPVAWLLLVTGVVAGRRTPLVRTALPSAVVPSVLLLGATAIGTHLYSPSYATMSTPFVALLVGRGALAVSDGLRGSSARRRQVLRAGAVVAVAAVTLPGLVAVRLPHAKWDLYWPEAAALVAAQRSTGGGDDPSAAGRSRTGRDGIVHGPLAGAPWSDGSRRVTTAYPDAYAGMRDLAVTTDAGASGLLFDRSDDVIRTVPTRLAGIDRVWYVGERDGDTLAPALRRALERHGFSVASRSSAGQVLVVRFERREA